MDISPGPAVEFRTLLRAEQAASSNGTSLRLMTFQLLLGGCWALCKCKNFLQCLALMKPNEL
jgi:hypothetical protein